MEKLCRLIIIRNNTFAMAGAVFGNMCHGLLNAVHNLDGKTQIAVFRRPVFFRCRMHLTAVLLHSLVTTYFYGRRIIHHQHHRQEFIRNILMHQQCFHRIAYGRTLHLGIESNFHRHLHIGILVNIGMTYARTCFDNWHAGITHYRLNQAGTAARNNNINQAVHMDQILHSLSVTGINKLNRARRNTCTLSSLCQNCSHSFVGLHCLAATLKNNSIAGFQAKACGICRNIRTCFINNTDNAQWNTNFSNMQTVRQSFAVNNITNRVSQTCYLTQAVSHTADALGSQLQAVQHRAFHALGCSSSHVTLIRSQNFSLLCLQRSSHRQKCRILNCGRSNGKLCSSLLRSLCLSLNQFIRCHNPHPAL